MLSGCTALEKKQMSGAAVEVNGHYLYRSTLDAITMGLNSEDSLRIAQQYIGQWARDILMYEAVSQLKSSISQAEIEQMVEDYRRSLYAHAYEEWLVNQQMSKTILDSTIQQVYDRMPERFMLKESVVKGLLVVVPNDAPNIHKLRKWMAEESLDQIEKYAYQIAHGYELFTDKWLTTSDVMSRMPIERNEWENRLKTKNQIEVSDSLKTYIIQVTDKQLRGTQMPVEMAREQIEQIILSERQVEFLQKERDRMYEEAVQQKKIIFF
jgi:tRNA(Glu) U13 pseudouridine synthase TruD